MGIQNVNIRMPKSLSVAAGKRFERPEKIVSGIDKIE